MKSKKEWRGQDRSSKHTLLTAFRKWQMKSRPTCVQSPAHHVTDLQKMGNHETQTFSTLDTTMGIATNVRWSTRTGSRTSLVTTLANVLNSWRIRQTQATGEVPLTSTNASIRLSDHSFTWLRELSTLPKESSRNISTSWKGCESEIHSLLDTTQSTPADAKYHRDPSFRWRSLLRWWDHEYIKCRKEE